MLRFMDDYMDNNITYILYCINYKKELSWKKLYFCHEAHNEDSHTILLFLYKYTVCYNILHYFLKNELETY